ncbi:MAG: matrixin family metalloprotease [Gemmatimonadetes bacterium]|nr:matrixin family metalloprotease [Gemmatimonadota bacterium]
MALILLAAGCDVTAPDRTDTYGFRLQPENVVFNWPLERRPVRYFAQAIGALPEYVRDGLTIWEAQLLYGEFEGVLTTDSAGADIRVVLEGGVPPVSPLISAPAVQACTGSTSATLASATKLAGPMLIQVRWFPGFTPADVVNCISRVTRHEIGHSLGLFQHSSNPADLMYGVPSVREPSTRDRSTVQVLYHTAANLTPADRP